MLVAIRQLFISPLNSTTTAGTNSFSSQCSPLAACAYHIGCVSRRFQRAPGLLEPQELKWACCCGRRCATRWLEFDAGELYSEGKVLSQNSDRPASLLVQLKLCWDDEVSQLLLLIILL